MENPVTNVIIDIKRSFLIRLIWNENIVERTFSDFVNFIIFLTASENYDDFLRKYSSEPSETWPTHSSSPG